MIIDELSREDLLKLLRIFAKNWLAHDGCWFLAAEQRFGMETAMELDTEAWRCFSPVEAKRIMETFGIAENGGLAALEKALDYRLYAAINRQEAERVDEHTLRFRMIECRVQQARRRKGLPLFPCKSVGIVEYEQFARAVDPRLETTCISAPPDDAEGCYCEWEFHIPGERDLSIEPDKVK